MRKGKEGPRNVTDRGRKEKQMSFFSFSSFFLCFCSATCCFSKICRTSLAATRECLVSCLDVYSFGQIITVKLEYVVNGDRFGKLVNSQQFSYFNAVYIKKKPKKKMRTIGQERDLYLQ
jgi:hypothetical protein